VGKGDALLFYYAGHGLRQGPKGFVVPADGDPERPATMIDLAELTRGLRACAAHHTLLVLDCCFSGVALEPGSGVAEAVGDLGDRSLGVGGKDNLSRVFNRRAFQVITAGTGKEPVGDLVRLSQEYAELARVLPEFQGHSPFTAVLLQALRGLTGRADGKQLASALGFHMNDVLVNDERIGGARQAPRYGALGQGDGDFVFLPAHKVLNPKLVAPLYLPGAQYADLRASAGKALRQFLAAQPDADRLPLARSAVPHLARLLLDPDEGPRLLAAQVLAELAERYGADAPEFAEARDPLAALLARADQPDELRRQAARALEHLAPLADDKVVTAFADCGRSARRVWPSV
jgi:hypothetical protein